MSKRITSMPTPSQLARRGHGIHAPMSRRTVLNSAAGVGALGTLAACGGDDGGSSGGGGGSSDTVTLGSRSTEAVPKAAMAALIKAYADESGVTVEENATDPNTYQEQINSYLQGSPDDVFQWFAGYRARFFAEQGLTGDITDVWDEVGDNYSEGMKNASSAEDGSQIFLPLYYYPWAIFYRPSVFEAGGYEIPETMDELKALAEDMQAGGMVPFAFGASDGWPQMGTFDYLNMRTNGYQFHIDLMAGAQRWDSDEVKAVFETWASLLPFHQEDSLGRSWQEAATSLQNKEAGMFTLGLFLNQQFPEGEERDDLDFFNFPEIDPAIGSDAVEAPIDGFMKSADPKNPDAATAFLKFIGTPAAVEAYVGEDPQIAANEEADVSGYDVLQKKSVELVNSAANISQFLDRDTRPDFASTVIIPEFQRFIGSPDAIDDITSSIQAQAESIFPQS